jgi:hypothetical protein
MIGFLRLILKTPPDAVMNRTLIFLAACTIVLVFAIDATAQRRPAPRRTPTPPAPVASAHVKIGAEKVSTQIKNVTKFLYTLGGIATRIEDLDRESKTRSLSRAALDTNDANKRSVITAIRNLRAGIEALETEFRTTPALQRYAIHLHGISLLASECEQLAAAGRFQDAGRPLLEMVEKLADTLVLMP